MKRFYDLTLPHLEHISMITPTICTPLSSDILWKGCNEHIPLQSLASLVGYFRALLVPKCRGDFKEEQDGARYSSRKQYPLQKLWPPSTTSIRIWGTRLHLCVLVESVTNISLRSGRRTTMYFGRRSRIPNIPSRQLFRKTFSKD